jgi:monovalent cation/proton antiporter MnhG/PhaG subunit
MGVIASILLGIGVFFAVIGALGVWLMRDPYQRLHYLTLPCSVSGGFVTVAVLLFESQKQAAAKVALTALVLFAMNAVVTQATARAIWVRDEGCWPPREPPPPPPEGTA